MLGFGSGSIYNFGCYLVSLCNGLNDFGYIYTPRTLNELFKNLNLYTGIYKNYINVDQLANKLPNIFDSYKRIEPWSNMETLEWYLDHDYVVLAKVDARGIGGSGTHFVYIIDTDGENVVIFDPWFGDTILVAERYNKWNNILGLRVFEVKRIGEKNNTEEKDDVSDETMQINKSDFERLFKASELGDYLISKIGMTGNIADKNKEELYTALTKEINRNVDIKTKSLAEELESCQFLLLETKVDVPTKPLKNNSNIPNKVTIGDTELFPNGTQLDKDGNIIYVNYGGK